jgi:hypothetical protein
MLDMFRQHVEAVERHMHVEWLPVQEHALTGLQGGKSACPNRQGNATFEIDEWRPLCEFGRVPTGGGQLGSLDVKAGRCH